MPVNRKTERFLQSLADVSRIHFQILDSKGSLHFSTQANRSQQPDAARCLKYAKKVIESRAFAYAAPSPNRHLCGIPIGLGDGTGYPEGLKGEQLPLAARILAVADTFDAITSSRSYHKPRSPREAMRVLDQVAGTQLDARLVTLFKTVFRQLDHGATKVKKAVNA